MLKATCHFNRSKMKPLFIGAPITQPLRQMVETQCIQYLQVIVSTTALNTGLFSYFALITHSRSARYKATEHRVTNSIKNGLSNCIFLDLELSVIIYGFVLS